MMSVLTSFGGSMGGKVPPVPVVDPPVVPPVAPPVPPVVVLPPLPPPPPLPPLALVPEVVVVFSELQPWNVDHATTVKTTGIANRAILMASPYMLRKLAFCRRRRKMARGRKECAEASASQRKNCPTSFNPCSQYTRVILSPLFCPYIEHHTCCCPWCTHPGLKMHYLSA
jgi:hypothetical protein